MRRDPECQLPLLDAFDRGPDAPDRYIVLLPESSYVGTSSACDLVETVALGLTDAGDVGPATWGLAVDGERLGERVDDRALPERIVARVAEIRAAQDARRP